MARSSNADRPAPREGEARDAYLHRLGERVREERTRRGMTRKSLALQSGVSERYLAQLEAGLGNISIGLLLRVADALNVPIGRLVGDAAEDAPQLRLTLDALRGLGPEALAEVRRFVANRLRSTGAADRRRRIALIGLRGAGKSTLGARLAQHLGTPFIELDAEIEAASGVSLSEIFALYGQAAYRRFERQALDAIVARHQALVLAAGGSIVAEAETLQQLLASCLTVWVKARPEEHMSRVVAQGDFRPMADNKEAMADLKRILAAREPLYARADATLDTAGATLEESFADLLRLIDMHQNA